MIPHKEIYKQTLHVTNLPISASSNQFLSKQVHSFSRFVTDSHIPLQYLSWALASSIIKMHWFTKLQTNTFEVLGVTSLSHRRYLPEDGGWSKYEYSNQRWQIDSYNGNASTHKIEFEA